LFYWLKDLQEDTEYTVGISASNRHETTDPVLFHQRTGLSRNGQTIAHGQIMASDKVFVPPVEIKAHSYVIEQIDVMLGGFDPL